MNLHNYKTAFQGAIVATAQHFGISEIYVEKDYWVTLALKEIFTNKSTSQLAVFKGGTSLSKCFGIIERFSEDIDLVVIKEEGETDNSLKRKLKKVTGVLEPVMTVIPEHPLENKRGKIRKVVYVYDKVGVEGAFGQIRDHIVVEASSLGKSHPSEIVSVHSLIAAFIARIMDIYTVSMYLKIYPTDLKVKNYQSFFMSRKMELFIKWEKQI